MIIFLDTSSLLKLYHSEVGTEELLTFISSGIEAIYLSELAILEFRSAILKKVRTSEITEATALELINYFEKDAAKFKWIPINQEIIIQANLLLMKYGKIGLRTLDALQFACALTLRTQENTCFVTADNLLKTFFEQEKLITK